MIALCKYLNKPCLSNMSLTYNKEISNLEFSLELGEKNSSDIEKRIQELIKTKNYILEMKQNNTLSLSILNKKKLQENIDIKFLPFLPKEVNSLIREKIKNSMYDGLSVVYENMIKDILVLEQYKCGMKFLNANMGDEFIFQKDTDGFRFNDRAGHKLFWRQFMDFSEDFNDYTHNLGSDNKYDYKKLYDIEITNKIIKDFISTITRKFEYSRIEVRKAFCMYNMLNVYENIDSNDVYNLNNNFEMWHKMNLYTYLKKNIRKIISYSIEVEVEVCKNLNIITDKIYKCMSKENETKYWNMLYKNHEWKKMYNNLVYNYDTIWNGSESNDSKMQEKFCKNFIDKKKIPIFNKNNKLSNKTNYALMGYDIVKYFQYHILSMRFECKDEDGDENEIYNRYSGYDKWTKLYLNESYYPNLFKNYYLTNGCDFKDYYINTINKSSDTILDWEEVEIYKTINEGDLKKINIITKKDFINSIMLGLYLQIEDRDYVGIKNKVYQLIQNRTD